MAIPAWLAALEAAAASAGTTVSGLFNTKSSAVKTTLTKLQGLGPTADPNELNGLLASLRSQLAQLTPLPDSEFAFENILVGLVGKTDAVSITQWSEACAGALTALANA